MLHTHFDAVHAAMMARPLLGFCDDLSPVRAFLEEWLPDDVHLRVSGRLHIVLSGWPFLGFRVVSQFASKNEVVDAVVCSCSLIGFVWRPQCILTGYVAFTFVPDALAHAVFSNHTRPCLAFLLKIFCWLLHRRCPPKHTNAA
jgi:hypothetical protein